MFDNGLAVTMVIVSAVFVLVSLYYLLILFGEIFNKKRSFAGNGIQGMTTLLFSVLLLGGIAYCLYRAPDILFYGTTWEMIMEYGPSALIIAVWCLSVVLPMFYLYFILSYFFTRREDQPYFMVIVLSILSAIGNSIIIFTINAALNRIINEQSQRAGMESGLYLYFLLGIILFTINSMIVRKKLIAITSEVVYSKRITIINKILKTPFEKFDALGDGQIQAVLNNDTEVISGFVNAFISGLTGLITLATCFIYLGTLNIYGLICSLFMVGLSVALFMMVNQAAQKKFEENRDIQNLFFKYIHDMVCGFKELFVNQRRRNEFKDDIEKSCRVYRDTRIEGEFKLIGVSVLGEILYLGVIGIVVFLFPLFLPNLKDNTLRNYVLVYLYMGNVVNQEIVLVPLIMRVMVSWKRINRFIDDILINMAPFKEPAAVASNIKDPAPLGIEGSLEIKLSGVKFQYKNGNSEKFVIGPIDYVFKSGEITFIFGGNGSGKSTLAKLITGLYKPDEGLITVNGRVVDAETLGSYFSIIFSDFYLFDKMYGIDYARKTEEIKKYLDILRMSDKVAIRNGEFNTLKLSTGQRKRLALLVSYLEDRPVCLFDEWAADQDPEFKRFFYRVLLPELKVRGKAVIAITHDDRFLNEADRLIKMEMGQIIESKERWEFDHLGNTGA